MKTVPYLLALLALFAACAVAQDQAASLTSNSVYEKNCAKCHGKTAEGRHFGGPSLRSAKVSSAPADDLRSMITNGKGRMPKFAGKLEAADIDTLVSQIKAGAK